MPPPAPSQLTLLLLSAAFVTAYALRRRRRLVAAAQSKPEQPKRDLRGYGPSPPDANWPCGALLAVNFAINIEEGSEPNMPDGDPASTAALCECPSDAPQGVRDLAAESMFEFGSRVGIWRVLRAFEKRGLPATAFACSLALERLPEIADAVRRGVVGGLLDVCCHGLRWEDHIAMGEAEERDRIARAVASLTATLGAPPRGWYCRTAPSLNTRRLLLEHGGFAYDSDAYNDELPYWTSVPTAGGALAHHLVLPYTLCTNDSKFAPGRAFSTADDFFDFCRAAVDGLLAEAAETGVPKMLSIGLHPRLIGHPARAGGLHRLLDYLAGLGSSRVWVARRVDIARHWALHHPPPDWCPDARAAYAADAAAEDASDAAGYAAAAAAAAAAATASSSSAASSSASTTAAVGSAPTAAAHGAAGGPRLLITGGGGFVLSHVVAQWLQHDAAATVVVFDRASAAQLTASDADARRFFAPLLASGRLAFFSGDVGDEGSWARLAAAHGTAFTHVVAGAALTPTPDEEVRYGAATIARVNLMGVLHAFEFARVRCGAGAAGAAGGAGAAGAAGAAAGAAAAGAAGSGAAPRGFRRFVLISSDAVLSAPQIGGAELCRPSTPAVAAYPLSKLAAEAQLARWREIYPEVDCAAVRFSDVWGAMDRDTGARNRHNAPYHVIGRAVRRQPIVLEAASLDDVGWDLVDGPSAARGVLAVLLHPLPCKRLVYELGLGRTVAWRELLAAIAAVPPAKLRLDDFARRFAPVHLVPPNVGGSGDVEGAPHARTLSADHWLHTRPMDAAAPRDELGWVATPLPEAVAEYVRWLQAGMAAEDEEEEEEEEVQRTAY